MLLVRYSRASHFKHLEFGEIVDTAVYCAQLERVNEKLAQTHGFSSTIGRGVVFHKDDARPRIKKIFFQSGINKLVDRGQKVIASDRDYW